MAETEHLLKTLQPEQIKVALHAMGLSSHRLHYREVSESTNTDVLEYYLTHQLPSIAICEKQTAGKGRRGRSWHSPFAQNVYCSIGIEKTIAAAHLGLMSIVSGIALCRALSSCGFDEVKLKWPNDLYHLKQKLGGILIESKPAANDSYFLVIGFGLNVFMSRQQLGKIPQAATSLSLVSHNKIDRQQILLAAIEAVMTEIDEFDKGSIPELISKFRQNDAFHQQRIAVLSAGKEIHGINQGITPGGLLRLVTESGEQTFAAAEISLRGLE
ncbi:MAG: biotin--[acetyl-CoA-carboxylase] ligase [Gammaproteobacteria bacterium]|nr:biotin--[acetyl-CoA-carboxylase] ligase [Gammaproteobacteria bacterium]